MHQHQIQLRLKLQNNIDPSPNPYPTFPPQDNQMAASGPAQGQNFVSPPIPNSPTPIDHFFNPWHQRQLWKYYYHLYTATFILSLVLIPLQIWHLVFQHVKDSPSWGPLLPEELSEKWEGDLSDTKWWVLWGAIFVGVSELLKESNRSPSV